MKTLVFLSLILVVTSFVSGSFGYGDLGDTLTINTYIGNITNLSEMQDVNIPAPTDNQLLQYDSGTSMLQGIEIEAEKQNVELVTVEVEYAASDLSAAAITIVEADVDFIIVAANQANAATAMKALEVAGSDVDCITSYVNASPSFAALIKDTLDSFDVYAGAWVDFFEADGVTPTAEYDLYVAEMSTFNNDYVASVYAMTGWIAASFFVSGLERVDGELTWETFIDAMESAPIQNPFGGMIDYADGARVGTQSMALTKAAIIPAAGDNPEGYVWNVTEPIESIDDILGN